MAALGGPDWLQARRAGAWERFGAMPLPSESEEVWRYSPIDRLDLEAFAPASGAGVPGGTTGYVADPLGVVVVRDGRPLSVPEHLPEGVRVTPASAHPDGPAVLGAALEGGDALVQLHDALLLDAVVVDVAPGVMVERPLLVHHSFGDGEAGGPGPAAFPRTVVRLGRGAHLEVVEVFDGALEGPHLVLPVTELVVADGASLSYAALELLGPEAWTIGRLSARVGQDASSRVFTAGIGAAYDRLRSDVAVTGRGASSELCSVYLGGGNQVHDVRTLQDHVAPHTVSELLCKGAVAGASRSVYSGLIRVRPGAVRADAMQSNFNLVLGEHAHADSVPNLDIQENDVRCSHASSVGPVGVDELFYLESRGVPPERAERLIVLGFFEDAIGRCPVGGVKDRLRSEVGLQLAEDIGDPSLAGAMAGARRS